MKEHLIKKNGKIYFDIADIPIRSNDSVATLTKIIQDYDNKAAPDVLFNKKRNEATDDLRAVCHKTFGMKANVYIFGSCINGFGTKSSDVDCFIMSKFDIMRKNSYMTPLLDALRKRDSSFKVINFVRKAKAPVITVQHKKNQLEMDITFASDQDPRSDVLENSKLLNTYAMKDPKIAAIGRFIKFILSENPGLGSAKVGGLSSYSHMIMFIYFLLHGQHKVKHVAVQATYLNKEEKLKASAGDIFLDFLRFYACEFDSSKYSIDIRFHDVRKIMQNEDSRIFTVEDPIIEKNLGKSMSPNRVYNLKLYYYWLLCTISEHNLNATSLESFIRESHFSTISNMEMPKRHPFCVPDIDKNHKKGSSRTKKDAEVTKPSGDDQQASSKNTIKNTRKGNGKNDASSHTQGPNSEFLLDQKDPYLLEELMKELKTPEKTVTNDNNVLSPERVKKIENGTAQFAKALLEENKKLTVDPAWTVVNYQGTDFIGDSRNLIVIPLLAALDFKVPSIQVGNCVSLEKLKCIPGFVPELTLSQMNTMIDKVGCFMGYSSDLNTPENKMREILESVGTINSAQLDLARHFSLYAACGTEYVLGDVNCSHDGGRGRSQAYARAQNITNLAKKMEVKCRTQVSDGTVPYSNMIGYTLEIQDVIEVLDGEGSSDMMDVIALQCAHILQMTGKVTDLKEGEKLVFETLADGKGLTKFLEMLMAQGVSQGIVDKLKSKKYDEVFPQAPSHTKIEAVGPGIITDIRLDALEKIVAGKLGGYNGTGTGIKLHVDIGSRINEGSLLLTVYHDGLLTSKTMTEFLNAFEIQKIQFQRIIRTFRNESAGGKKQRNRKSSSKDKNDKKDADNVVEEAVSSSPSVESVPKDYVVVVSTENENDRTVSEKTEE